MPIKKRTLEARIIAVLIALSLYQAIFELA
jgi:hypothetical protein